MSNVWEPQAEFSSQRTVRLQIVLECQRVRRVLTACYVAVEFFFKGSQNWMARQGRKALQVDWKATMSCSLLARLSSSSIFSKVLLWKCGVVQLSSKGSMFVSYLRSLSDTSEPVVCIPICYCTVRNQSAVKVFGMTPGIQLQHY